MYGLYYIHQGRPVSLPLLGVRAEATLKELAAQVKLTQAYGNDAKFPIEAIYSFAIPARASVFGFVMIKQNGSRIVGKVLEKVAARKTYDTAVAKGQQTSLMEQQTNDVFQVSVGNIPPREQVQIELLYATEVAEDEDNDSIRFHLPFQVGARYGNAPAPVTPFTATSALTSRSTPFLIISANVEAVAPIAKIGSPSHTISTELGPDPALPNFKELPFSNYARVSLSSDSTLKKDFVLTVKYTGLDAPRCVAEPHPTHNTAALALSFVPRFTLPDLARQEFILLVDRSGSMANKRIAAARKALVVLLRALPHEGTLFQIVSFGSRASALWPTGSRPYDQGTLEEATRHVDGMDADYGGTEIRRALGTCFKERAGDRPTSVLVLTDGEAWDTEGVLADVKAAVRAAPEDAPLRVSVLGIGDSVSTAMCEGIARLGHGTCMLVAEEEITFTGKVARLLKAARTPVISNITVDWGREADEPEDGFEVVEKEEMVGAKAAEAKQKTLNIFDETVDPTHLDRSAAPPAPQVILPPPPAVQQSPLKIHNLFPGTRVNIYAILKGKSSIPTTVTLRGATPDGASITLDIPVTLSRLPSTPALHALAARKIIQDLEDGQHAAALTASFKNPGDTDLLARTVRASIVRLGTTYTISSSHTSFVAVDEANADAAAVPQEQAPPSYTVRTSPPTYVDSYDSGVQSQARGGSSYSASRAYSYDPSIMAVSRAYVPTVTAEYDPTIEDIPTVGPGSPYYDPTVESVDVYRSQEEYSVPRRPTDQARGRSAAPADLPRGGATSSGSAKKSKAVRVPDSHSRSSRG
ncbi:von Willebrand factor type A domain-containing protein [Mycena filopes]|nr:von Willebrand factor type A domain-containing protein [Mycena filopes]